MFLIFVGGYLMGGKGRVKILKSSNRGEDIHAHYSPDGFKTRPRGLIER